MRRLRLVLLLPLAGCQAVMDAWGDEVAYAPGRPWHTVPAAAGLAVSATVLPLVLSPLLVVEIAVGERLGYADLCTAGALGVGVAVATPWWLAGLPFAGRATAGIASVADHGQAGVVEPDPRQAEVERQLR